MFIYLVVKILRVDFLILLVIVGDDNIICIYGFGFLSRVLDLDIKIGNIFCVVMLLLEYLVLCWIGLVVVGIYDVKIYVVI